MHLQLERAADTAGQKQDESAFVHSTKMHTRQRQEQPRIRRHEKGLRTHPHFPCSRWRYCCSATPSPHAITSDHCMLPPPTAPLSRTLRAATCDLHVASERACNYDDDSTQSPLTQPAFPQQVLASDRHAVVYGYPVAHSTLMMQQRRQGTVGTRSPRMHSAILRPSRRRYEHPDGTAAPPASSHPAFLPNSAPSEHNPPFPQLVHLSDVTNLLALVMVASCSEFRLL